MASFNPRPVVMPGAAWIAAPSAAFEKRQYSTLGYRSPGQFLENWIREQHQEKLVA